MELWISYIIISFLTLYNKNKQKLNILILITLIIIASISSFSRDYLNYVNLFNNNFSLSEIIINKNFVLNPDLRIEVGFKFFISLIKIFTKNFNIFLFFYSTTSLILRYSLYKKVGFDTNLILLSYLSLRYLPNELTQYRSSMASALLVYSTSLIVKKNSNKFIVCILCAFLFHKGALIFLPLYYIYPYFFKFKYKLLGFLFVLLFTLKQNIVINVLNTILKNDNHFLLIKLNNEGVIPKMPLLPLVVTILGILNFEKIKNEYFRVATYYMYISIVCYSLMSGIPELAIRISNYLYDSQPIILVSLIYQIKNKYFRFFLKVVLIIFLGVIFYKSYKIIFQDVGYKSIINI